MRVLRIHLAAVILGIALSLFSATAFAQDDPCYSLDANEDWWRLFSEFSSAFTAKDYKLALAKTQELQNICARSAVLNLSIATTYRELGEDTNALKYYRIAAENSKEFNVPDEMLQKIWYGRYELEKKDILCNRSELDTVKGENEANKQRIQELNAELDASKQATEYSQRLREEEHGRFKTILWTGVGVGAAGLVLGITGGALLGSIDPVNEIGCKDTLCKETKYVKLHGAYRPAWTLVGLGIGMTAAGALMAGIGGYFYSHGSDSVALSWEIGPGSLEMGLTF